MISDNGQNLRHNLADGTTTEDTTLTTPPATGPTRGVTAAAYTNNDLNAETATTLFDINTATDQAVIQSPAQQRHAGLDRRARRGRRRPQCGL